MKPLDGKRVLWIGLGLLIVTNVVVLGGALYNRSGEPQAVLRLSERELELPYRYGFERENSGLSLELRWRVPRSPGEGLYGIYGEGTPWLDKAKLTELGFDMSRSPYTAAGARYYAKQLPREVFLVLEFDGAAYRTALQRAEEQMKRAGERAAANPAVKELSGNLERATANLDSERNRNSRLFVVDAGRDSAALRAKYADRAHYAIVPGIVRVTTQRRGTDAAPVGYVDSLSVNSIEVPAAHRWPFAAAYKDAGEGAPRAGKYAVAVAFGKRLEPWILDVRGGDK